MSQVGIADDAIEEPYDRLTDEERELFERIRERHEDDDIAAICDAVLQSSSTDSEDASA